MSWVPAVGRHCIYLKKITYAGNAEYVKRVPCIITEIAADDNPVLICKMSGETFGDSLVGIAPREHPDDASDGVYVTY